MALSHSDSPKAPAPTNSDNRAIVVTSLNHRHPTPAQLASCFSRFGSINTIFPVEESDGLSSTTLFFDDVHSATAALNNFRMAKKKVISNVAVEVHRIGEPCRAPAPMKKQHDDRNVYVASLPSGFTEQKLKDLFSEFGEVFSVIVKPPKKSRSDSPYGFVFFYEESSAIRAVNAFAPPSGRLVEGRIIQVRLADKGVSKDPLYEEFARAERLRSHTRAVDLTPSTLLPAFPVTVSSQQQHHYLHHTHHHHHHHLHHQFHHSHHQHQAVDSSHHHHHHHRQNFTSFGPALSLHQNNSVFCPQAYPSFPPPQSPWQACPIPSASSMSTVVHTSGAFGAYPQPPPQQSQQRVLYPTNSASPVHVTIQGNNHTANQQGDCP